MFLHSSNNQAFHPTTTIHPQLSQVRRQTRPLHRSPPLSLTATHQILMRTLLHRPTICPAIHLPRILHKDNRPHPLNNNNHHQNPILQPSTSTPRPTLATPLPHTSSHLRPSSPAVPRSQSTTLTMTITPTAEAEAIFQAAITPSLRLEYQHRHQRRPQCKFPSQPTAALTKHAGTSRAGLSGKRPAA